MTSVFVTLPLPSPGIDLLRERFDVTMLEAEGMPENVLADHIKKTDPVGIVGMVNVPITDRIMAAAPHLRVVANYAVGYNNVDLAAATRRGIMGDQHARRVDRGDRRSDLGLAARGRATGGRVGPLSPRGEIQTAGKRTCSWAPTSSGACWV